MNLKALLSGAALLALGAVSAQAQNFGSNILINPWMEIDQVNEGASTTLTASSAGTYTYRSQGDGWGGTAATSASTIATLFQNAAIAPNGSVSDVKVTVGTGSATHATGTVLDIEQRVEPVRAAKLAYGTTASRPSTLQFCAKASLAGTYSFFIANGRVQDLASPTGTYYDNFVLTAANWSCFKKTIPANTGGTWLFTTNTVDATHGLTLGFTLGVGATAGASTCSPGAWSNTTFCIGKSGTNASMDATTGSTFELTGVKWSVDDDTPLQHVPDLELMQAQRYYSKTFNVGSGGVSGVAPAQNLGLATAKGFASSMLQVQNVATLINWQFPVKMRAAPTVTAYSPGAATSACYDISNGAAYGATTIEGGITSNLTNTNSVAITCAAGTAAVAARIGIGLAADARL